LSGETALAHFRPTFGQDSAHPAHNMRRGATGTRATTDGGAPGGTPVMQTPPGRQEAIDATRAQVNALQLEVDVLSVQSAGSLESTGADLAAADPAPPRVGSLADWQQPAVEIRQSSTASRSSKEVKSWKKKSLLELVNANVPQAAAVLMVEDHISLAFACRLGAAEMATFFTDKGMYLSPFDANRLSMIFSTPSSLACEPPLSVPLAPPPSQPGPVLASLLAFPPGMGGPGIAAQISGGGGVRSSHLRRLRPRRARSWRRRAASGCSTSALARSAPARRRSTGRPSSTAAPLAGTARRVPSGCMRRRRRRTGCWETGSCYRCRLLWCMASA
jgi:hypothetical protein